MSKKKKGRPNHHIDYEKNKFRVYFILAHCWVKIGYSEDVEQRLATFQTGCPYEMRIHFTLPCESEAHARDLERTLHDLFKKRGAHHRGEWFKWQIVKPILSKFKRAAGLRNYYKTGDYHIPRGAKKEFVEELEA